MNASTITVHWHNDSQPIYAVDFQPNPSNGGPSQRLITGGGDNNIRVWKLNHQHNKGGASDTSIEYLSTLRKHTQAVNVIRFDPSGEILASAGDDGTLIFWKLAKEIIKDFETEEDDDDAKESWQAVLQVRSSTSEINDICWSPNSQYIVTGSMDNTLRIYQLGEDPTTQKLTGKLIESLKNHSHYVQGVYWDPLNEFIASQSADRSVIVYKIISQSPQFGLKLHHKFTKLNNQLMYHSETLQSFFRRLSFSPDGSFLITPAGIGSHVRDSSPQTPSKSQSNDSDTKPEIKFTDEGTINTAYVYLRSSLSTSPVLKIAGLNKPAIAVAFNPHLYVKDDNLKQSITSLDYKMIFAIATQDSVLVYSTDTFKPLAFVSNLHYSSITDLKWDLDGSKIIVSSTDGFCSVVSFDEGIFGNTYKKPLESVAIEDPIVIDEAPIVDEIPITVNDKEALEKVKIEPTKDATSVEPSENTIISNEDPMDICPPEDPVPEKTPTKAKTTIDMFYKPKEKKRIAPTLVSNS